jgi:DNA-binding NarL/FixJ family response regulator
VLLVDDHAIFREAMCKLLENEPYLFVAGEAGDGNEAVRLAAELQPDLLLLDLRLPGIPGLSALREIATVAPSVRTLVLTAEISDADVVQAFQLGARGIVMKHSSPEVLLESIRTVVAGGYCVGRECVAGLVENVRERNAMPELARAPMPRLTPREQHMVSAVVAGCSNAEIARKFGISPKTVKHHLTNVFQKLGVSNRLALALLAVQRRFDRDRLDEF